VRKAVYHLLTTDAPLLALLPAEHWYERGSVPDSPPKLFAVLAWQGVTRVGRANSLPRLTIWVHDRRGSYDKVDKVLARCTELLEAVQQYEHDGQRIAQADFEGSSVDLYDDVYRSNTRNAGYRVVGSGL
jgi:hypothetical protein